MADQTLGNDYYRNQAKVLKKAESKKSRFNLRRAIALPFVLVWHLPNIIRAVAEFERGD